MKINKKTVSHFLGLAVLLGAVELTHQLTKTEKQTTYSVTLEDLALGNGETNGENGGSVGGGGADGESDEGTTIRNGYNDIIITRISQEEVKDVSTCLFKTRTRDGLLVTCDGLGSLPCLYTRSFSSYALEFLDI